jgi:hypothetical protein
MKLLLSFLIALITVAPSLVPQARGDNAGARIHLRNGTSQAGVLRPRDANGDTIWLERDLGVTVSYTRSEISRIEPTETRLSWLYTRAAAVDDMEDVATRLPARRTLAIEAEEQGFPQFAQQQARLIIQEANATQSPDATLRAAAHTTLGHVLHDGVWMTDADAWAARGYVRLGGRWVPAAERERVLAERAADRRHRAEMRLQRHQLAAERLAAAAVDQVSVLTDGGYGYSPLYWGGNPGPGQGPHRQDRRHHRPTSVRQLWDTPWWADTVHARTYGKAASRPRGRPLDPHPLSVHTAPPRYGGGGIARAPRDGLH